MKKDSETDCIQNQIQKKDMEILTLYQQNKQLIRELAVLKNVISLMPNHFYWKNKEGIYLGCNDDQARFLGLNSGEDVIGKTDEELPWGKEGVKYTRKVDLQVIETAETLLAEESTILPNGEPAVFHSTKRPLYDPQTGNIIGILGISVNITELKNLQSSLIQAKEKAEAANKAKSQFLANLSHDLRTPLSSLVALTTYIANNTQKQEINSFAVDAENCAEQVLELIDEVLEITKINSGKFIKEDQVFELKKLIDSTIKLMQPAANQKNLQMQIDIDPLLPAFFVGRYQAIHRILLNLLSNAIKFTHEGRIVISLKLLQQSDDQIKIKLSVQDTGIGIAAEHHEKIFEQFERLNSSYEEQYDGRGLGLYIVKQFADLLNATIHVKSAIGQGTTIALEFPLKIAADLTSENIPAVNIKSPRTKKENTVVSRISNESQLANNQIKILLVEDTRIAQLVAKIALSKLASQIDVAETGQQAIQLATSSHYDLVLLDIGLPDMSGLEVAKTIRQFEMDQNREPVPIIGLTAHLSCPHQALIAGIQQVLYKPLTVEKAEVILKNWIQALQLQNHNVQVEATKSTELPIDLALAEKLTGNKKLAKSMLEDFIQALPQDLQKIKDAFNSKDKEFLQEAVHYLNGGASYAGVPLLKKALNSLEVALSDNFSDAEIAELFSDICIEAEKVLEFHNKFSK